MPIKYSKLICYTYIKNNLFLMYKSKTILIELDIIIQFIGKAVSKYKNFLTGNYLNEIKRIRRMYY